MVRNVLRRLLLAAFDMTAGLAFVAGLVSGWALVEVAKTEGFRDDLLFWMVFLGLSVGYIYQFSRVRDEVRARILHLI